MDKDRIHKVLEDNILLEDFSQLLIDEINNDDEILEKKARQLLNLCLKDEKIKRLWGKFRVAIKKAPPDTS